MNVFKIMRAAEWDMFMAHEVWAGSADDARDGFVHLSAAGQVAGTAARHFAGEAGLVLAAFDADMLGPALKWDVSRGGSTFPHLYAPLRRAALTGHWPLADWLALPPAQR